MDSYISGLPVIFNVVILILSLSLLIKSSEWMVDGAVGIATKFQVSPLIIGATFVAMGTSLAELAVNLVEVLSHGETEAVMGNIVGSNAVNIGLGLGIPAIIATIRSKIMVIEKEIPLYFAFSALLTSMATDGHLKQGEGVILISSFIVVLYLIYQYALRERRLISKKRSAVNKELNIHQHSKHNISSRNHWFYLTGGLIFLVIAARFLVISGSVVAISFGISKYIIGLTIVGIGTSLPEIMASIQAARKGHTDIVLGNVFGSNIFNIAFGLGLPMLITNIEVPHSILKDMQYVNIMGLSLLFILLIENKLVGNNKALDKTGGFVVVGSYAWFLISKL